MCTQMAGALSSSPSMLAPPLPALPPPPLPSHECYSHHEYLLRPRGFTLDVPLIMPTTSSATFKGAAAHHHHVDDLSATPRKKSSTMTELPSPSTFQHEFFSSPPSTSAAISPSSSPSDRIRLRIVDLDAEIERINRESVQSTRNMVKDVEEANESGIRTLAALEEQDEQLERIETDLTRIQEDLGVMEQRLARMRLFCGLGHYVRKYLCTPFKRRFLRIASRRASTASASSASSPSRPLVVSLPASGSGRRHSSHQSAHQKDSKKKTSFRTALASSSPAAAVYEDEIERNLTQVDGAVRTLKEVAFDIHTQIELQRPKIDRLASMAEQNDSAINGANRTVLKMLK